MRSRLRTPWLGALCAVSIAWCATAASAQEAPPRAPAEVRVEASVSALSAGSVYLDRGRAAGLAVGDRVVFRDARGGLAEGVVRSVSKSSSRVELSPGSASLAVGARAEILVPAERLRASDTAPATTPRAAPGEVAAPPRTTLPAEVPPQGAPAGEAPPAQSEHPPWQHPDETWDPEHPLLAPAFGLPPEERERRFSGRVYARWTGTFDEERDRSYALSTLGVDGRIENPFGRGGAFELDVEAFRRETDTSSADDETSRLWWKRLSYWEGGSEDRPARWQAGRFLHHEFPELGVVDGLEWSSSYGEGKSRFGASFGGAPEPFPDSDAFESVQASVFQRWSPDRDGRFALGTAYQNTWFEGDQDRNLFVATLDWLPGDRFALRSAAWVDYYGPNDEVKSDGFELTELRLDGRYKLAERSGVGASFAHVRWPELLREEFSAVDPERLEENQVDRAGLFAWHGFSRRVRADARVDLWQDQDDEGASGELGLSLSDWIWSGGELGFAVFYADGTYSSGPGARVRAGKSFGRVAATVAYEHVEFDQKNFVGDASTLAHDGVTATFDFDLGASWDLSLFGDWRFGDELDGYTIGVLLQTRF